MKKISLIELLDLVRSGKAPKVVKYYGVKYFFFNSSGKYLAVTDPNLADGACIPVAVRRDLIVQIGMSEKHTDLAKNRKIIEVIEPVLDSVEKAYLGKIIRPFRDSVTYIKKYWWTIFDDGRTKYQIEIRYKDISGYTTLRLPIFDPKEKNMYAGMEHDKQYTLEELGL